VKDLRAENAVLKNLLRETVRAYEAGEAAADGNTDHHSSPKPVLVASTPPGEASEEHILRNLVAETTRVYEQQAAELARLQETARVLLATSQAAIISTNGTAAVTELNPMAETLTGLRSVAVRGRPLVHILNLSGPDGRAVLLDLAPCLLKGEGFALPEGLFVERRDGYHFAVAGRVEAIRDPQEAVVGMLLMMRHLGKTSPMAPSR
jgi:PAS domain S-box-containing protein